MLLKETLESAFVKNDTHVNDALYSSSRHFTLFTLLYNATFTCTLPLFSSNKKSKASYQGHAVSFQPGVCVFYLKGSNLV